MSHTPGMSLFGNCLVGVTLTIGFETLINDLQAFRYIPNIFAKQLIECWTRVSNWSAFRLHPTHH